MNPHDQPWLDDYETRHRVELQAKWDSEGEVFRIQNQAMKTVLRECPDPIRKPENCENCGNENCIKAWKEQNKLWNETEDQKSPASAAGRIDTAIHPEASKSNAATANLASTSCQLPGRPASGSTFFDLIHSQSEDEAA